MKELFDLIRKRIEEITEPIRPVGWSRKIEVVETKAVMDIVSEVEAEYGNGKTNADRIRSMSDEKLAEYIEPRWFDCSDFCEDFDAGCAYTCKHNKGAEFLLDWLKSPTTD